MEAQGWVQYDSKYKNFWGAGDDYDGYNTVMEHTETGQRVEIQYHIYESIQIKRKSHELYQQLRYIPESNQPQRKAVYFEMQNLWSVDYQKPLNFEQLAGVLLERVPE